MIARVFAGLLIGALGFISPVAAQENEIEPELVWTCPVHRDVTENEAGNCEFCERELIQTLVQQAWSCPIHSVISERAPGEMPDLRPGPLLDHGGSHVRLPDAIQR